MSDLFELFPTPVLRVPRLLDDSGVRAFRQRFAPAAGQLNHHSGELSHSQILAADADPLLADLSARLTPHLAEFGTHLFGQSLHWTIKEMWLNVMQTGGRQAIHTHANSFVSGVLYLSDCHPSSNTLFIRSLGGQGYVFANTHANAAVGPFNADKWRGPDPAPGDLILFPSSLLHEVPVNRGGLRVTLAFNAIPDRLDAWGYAITFGR
jgi:uncharacterized protein (TIGR02466 family)